MNIYKVDRTETSHISYYSYAAHIVVANSYEKAKDLVIDLCRDNQEWESEQPQDWELANVTLEGIYSGLKTEPFILLSDFTAG